MPPVDNKALPRHPRRRPTQQEVHHVRNLLRLPEAQRIGLLQFGDLLGRRPQRLPRFARHLRLHEARRNRVHAHTASDELGGGRLQHPLDRPLRRRIGRVARRPLMARQGRNQHTRRPLDMVRRLAEPSHELHREKRMHRIQPLRHHGVHKRQRRQLVETRTVDKSANDTKRVLHGTRHHLDRVCGLQIDRGKTRILRRSAQRLQTIRATRHGEDIHPSRDQPPREGHPNAVRRTGHYDASVAAHAITPAKAAKSATVFRSAKSPASTRVP